MGELANWNRRKLVTLMFSLILIGGFGGIAIYSFASSLTPLVTPTRLIVPNINVTNLMVVNSTVVGGSIIAREGFANLLWDVDGGHWETATFDTEYYGPNQYGGIYGTVYRTYFDSSLPAYLTQGNNVERLIGYTCYFYDDFRWVAEGHAGWGKPSELYYISLSGSSGAGNLSLTVSNKFSISDGWVDYTKP